MGRERRVVDNRVFLLGLDELYREAMKTHEATSLLSCARETAEMLSVSPANGPVEGYYSESEQLTEYFQLMRALQLLPRERDVEVLKSQAFYRLRQIAESPLYGLPHPSRYLLAAGKDSLSRALESTEISDWTISALTDSAYDRALNSQDVSLVALAALARDSVVLAALRESVVLYALPVASCTLIPSEPEYVWAVDERIQTRASQFVETFNNLFDDSLPMPLLENARRFWEACTNASIVGRCVRIGMDDSVRPNRHYHWAIDLDTNGLSVRDFWDTEIWTTDRYRGQAKH